MQQPSKPTLAKATALAVSTLTVVLCLLAPTSRGQINADSHEESVVRAAYSRLSYLSQVHVIGNTATAALGSNRPVDTVAFKQALLSKQVNFALSDFRSGPISEIASTRWGEMVSIPSAPEQELHFAVGSRTFNDGDLPQVSWAEGMADWAPAPEIPMLALAFIRAKSTKEMLELAGPQLTYPDVIYTRYASFTVTASYEKRTVGPYKAVFFFGKRNGQGAEVVGPVDNVTNATALFGAVSQPLYPSGLVRSRLRDIPIVTEWLQASQVTGQSCTAGKGELCCVGNKCGIAGGDLQNELAAPLLKPSPTHTASPILQ